MAALWVQIPLRYDPIALNMIRTGYVYLPSSYYNKALPVMVLFHGLEGYGLNIIQAGSGGTFQASCEITFEELLVLRFGCIALACSREDWVSSLLQRHQRCCPYRYNP